MTEKRFKILPNLCGVAGSMLITLTLISAPAGAAPVLPAATSVVDCTADDGSHVGGPAGCAVGHSTASVTTAPTVALTASAAYDASVPASSGGFANLTYSFAVLGGIQDTVVPVDVDFALQALVFSAGPSPAYAFSEIIANTPLSSGYAVICNTGCIDASTNLSGTFNLNVYAGEDNNAITLEIEALAAGYASIPANSATAFADPHIYIDPSFANAGTYTVALSDGIGNGVTVGAVPEPSSIVLMLCGLGLLGANGVRRKRP